MHRPFGLRTRISAFVFNGLSPHKSLQMRRLNRSVVRILRLLYPFPDMITIAERDVLIRRRFEDGEALTDIAVDFGISP